jgi:predicted AAA+ superfamily ATPase
MAFISGPRQIGKTTLARDLLPASSYLDWDDQDHRELILAGPAAVADHAGADSLSEDPPLLVLDELHRYRRWRTFLEGLFDTHGARLRIVVTGSSRLDVHRRGGDSLMGRYLPYRLHPFTAGELARPTAEPEFPDAPAVIDAKDWKALLRFGGYPELFVHRDARFHRRWSSLRTQQLVREDVRDSTRIQELDQLEMLVRFLAVRSSEQLSYASLARQVRISVDTARRWIATLVSLHHGFLVRPWYRNVSRALRKEPKWFLRDWSGIDDPGQRCETLVACHLLKAAETWTDLGLAECELRYVRDKEKNEVDFLLVRDGAPWLLVETKTSDGRLSPSLQRYQSATGAQHAFQVVLDAPFVDADPFAVEGPIKVPAQTLLSCLP